MLVARLSCTACRLRLEDSLIAARREGRQAVGDSRIFAKRSNTAIRSSHARPGWSSLLLAVPLLSRDRVTGTINIYTEQKRRHFTEEEIGFVKVVASQAATAIDNTRLLAETLEIKRQLETRKVVERAKGILQHKHKLTEEEAYLRLRNESRRLRRPMRDLAEAVIMADDLNRKEGDVGCCSPFIASIPKS